MNRRLLKHLFTRRSLARRLFPKTSLEAITHAIAEGERLHAGQLRFAVEAALPLPLAGQSARQRALQVFSHLRIWDTADNNGVLIYLLLADRSVEIIADRGINARVKPEAWFATCKKMENAYRSGNFAAGTVTGINEISALLAQHFPHTDSAAGNELPDLPVILDGDFELFTLKN